MLNQWMDKAIRVNASDSMQEILKKSTLLRPDKRQLDWQKMGFSVFVHFGVNTYTDREWGEGIEDPKIFNPVGFNADQWVETVKNSGAGLLILTCKHHDGFCLWPSKYTQHSVKNSPWKGGKGDIVREVSDACRKYGIKFGVYYSPWDRHEQTYGTDAYNTYYKNQLTELLTEYGEVYEYWIDGACGEGKNGKKQIYDWTGFWSLARELQPSIMVNGVGPDARWCGNEAGTCKEEEWSQVFIPQIEADCDMESIFALSVVNHNLSSECCKSDFTSVLALKKLYEGKNGWFMWYPSFVDTSIRPGWFYHANEDDKVRSLDNLIDLYIKSVGGNSMLLLNIPPDRRGLFHENDVRNMNALGDYIERVFSVNLLDGAKVCADSQGIGDLSSLIKNNGFWACKNKAAKIVCTMKNKCEFNLISIREPIYNGQSISSFKVEVLVDGKWNEIAKGSTIGSRRIFRIDKCISDKIRILVLSARADIALESISLHFE